jgi:TIR domain
LAPQPPRGKHNRTAATARHEKAAAVEKPHRRHGSAKDGRPPDLIQLHFRGKTNEIRLDSREYARMRKKVTGTRHVDRVRKAAHHHQLRARRRAGAPGRGRGQLAVLFVTGYLRPAIKLGAVDLWPDRLMPAGADWER